jgi:hypothetical protein
MSPLSQLGPDLQLLLQAAQFPTISCSNVGCLNLQAQELKYGNYTCIHEV